MHDVLQLCSLPTLFAGEALVCWNDLQSPDGRTLAWDEQGTASACSINATHCLYIKHLAVDKSTGQTSVKTTGACFHPRSVLESSASAEQLMLRRKGVVCDTNFDSTRTANDGSFVYACCTDAECNTKLAGTALDAELTAALTPDCTTPEAIACANKYARAYGCHVTRVPLPPDDACAKFVSFSSSCLATSACNCSCANSTPGMPNNGSYGTLASTGVLTPCQQLRCAQPRDGTCAPGCRHDNIGDGTCQGLCMNEPCNFDGGDCMPAWRARLSEDLLALDMDDNKRVTQDELDHPTASPLLSFKLPAPGNLTWCNVASQGLSEIDLPLVHLLESLESLSGQASDVKSITLPSAPFGLAEHPQLHALNTALYVMRAADRDLDGALSFPEAQTTFGLTWDEYTLLNTHAFGGSLVDSLVRVPLNPQPTFLDPQPQPSTLNLPPEILCVLHVRWRLGLGLSVGCSDAAVMAACVCVCAYRAHNQIVCS